MEGAYYLNMANTVSTSYQNPSEAFLVNGLNSKGNLFHQIKYSPNGNLLAYSVNFKGKYDVMVRDLSTGNEEKLLTGGYKVINQEIDEEIPLLSWKDNNTLGIINVEKGIYQLVMVDIASGNLQKRPLDKITQIKHLQFHDRGRSAVISADSRGQNDLFLLSLSKNTLRRVYQRSI